jgi:hypothetical protein
MKYLLLVIFLTGCNDEKTTVNDQCLRNELFVACMKNVPAGATHITAAGNDWDEVVRECGTQAYYGSMRKSQFVEPKCAL